MPAPRQPRNSVMDFVCTLKQVTYAHCASLSSCATRGEF